MQKARFTADNTDCTVARYQTEPDLYRGQLVCIECQAKSWFVRASVYKDHERAAFFAAHHAEGCNASSVMLVAEELAEPATDPHDFRVDLDKNSNRSVFIAEQAVDYLPPDDWHQPKIQKVLGPAEFPVNKSLRQLLSHLCRNPAFATQGQTIRILADSGREILSGTLQDLLVNVSQIASGDVGELRIFWGRIHNVNERDETLWLNMGNYQTEPSIVVEDELRAELLSYFRLSEAGDLSGADFILVGHCGQSAQHKYILRFAFPKYIAFRRFRVVEKAAIDDNTSDELAARQTQV